MIKNNANQDYYLSLHLKKDGILNQQVLTIKKVLKSQLMDCKEEKRGRMNMIKIIGRHGTIKEEMKVGTNGQNGKMKRMISNKDKKMILKRLEKELKNNGLREQKKMVLTGNEILRVLFLINQECLHQ